MSKQEAFGDIEREVRTIVTRVRRRSVENARMIDPDLTAPAFGVLLYVFDNGAVRAQEVVEAFGVDKATVSRQIAHLESLGLVARSVDPTDGRAYSVELTAEGRSRVDDLSDKRRSDFIQRLNDWSADDLEQLAELLSRYNASLES